MPGSSNFKIWNPAQNNQLSDGDYSTNTTRLNGATTGIYPSNLHNKFAFQTSTFIAAFTEHLSDLGFTLSDNDYAGLKTVFGNLLTLQGGSLLGALKEASTVNLASSSGVLTLPNTSNSFNVSGTEVLTSITGWTQGIAYVTWGATRQLVNSASLVLRGAASHAVAAGDVSIFLINGGTVTEIVYSPIVSDRAIYLNGWSTNKVVSVGDIAYSINMSSYKRVECVAAGTTGNVEPTWGNVGTLITDGSVTWIIDDVRDTTPVGRTVAEHLARSAYPRLWAFANSSGLIVSDASWSPTMLGAFSLGDGSTTFRVPDMRGIFPRYLDDGAGIDAGRVLGSFQADAIRNITGAVEAGSVEESSGTLTGAFALSNIHTGSPGGSSNYGFTFDASRVVPTAAENRPKNIALLACIKY